VDAKLLVQVFVKALRSARDQWHAEFSASNWGKNVRANLLEAAAGFA
jgi:hypothetical protein